MWGAPPVLAWGRSPPPGWTGGTGRQAPAAVPQLGLEGRGELGLPHTIEPEVRHHEPSNQVRTGRDPCSTDRSQTRRWSTRVEAGGTPQQSGRPGGECPHTRVAPRREPADPVTSRRGRAIPGGQWVVPESALSAPRDWGRLLPSARSERRWRYLGSVATGGGVSRPRRTLDRPRAAMPAAARGGVHAPPLDSGRASGRVTQSRVPRSDREGDGDVTPGTHHPSSPVPSS